MTSLSRKLEKILKVKALGKSSYESNLSKFEKNFTIETVKEDLDIKKKIISKFQTSISWSNVGDN